MLLYAGSGTPVSQAGLDAFCSAVSVAPAELWTVVCVETSGCGYLSDRRPKILFERHWFHQFTQGQYDLSHPDVSNPLPGGYGAGGANQYNRLAEAAALDPEAALKSASWGLPQIMGFNCANAGYDDVDSFAAAMVASEDNQLAAMSVFLQKTGLGKHLAAHDWVGFASGYNGPNYAANNYDGLLAQFYGKFSKGNLPDIGVRQAQMLLTYNGYNAGGIDGEMGPTTTAAITKYQTANNLPPTGTITPALLQALAG